MARFTPTQEDKDKRRKLIMESNVKQVRKTKELNKLRKASEREAFLNKDLASEKAGSPNAASGAQKTQALASGAQQIVTPSGETNTGAGVAQGALAGAATGAAVGGVPGAIVGGVVGGGVGALKASSARKRAQREAEAQKQEALAEIEQTKGARINTALANLGQSLGQTLLQKKQLRF